MLKVDYKGSLGEFSYDRTKWSILGNDKSGSSYLHWQGGNRQCDLPKGLKSCRSMFKNCTLGEGFSFGDFDTHEVTDMNSMFHSCVLPDSFVLGDQFDTSQVTNMNSMFYKCCFPKEFTLGDKFDTSEVTSMIRMFSMCILPEGFTLGDKFSTEQVSLFAHMFEGCQLPHDFSLGRLFKLTNCKSDLGMFKSTTYMGVDLSGMDVEKAVEILSKEEVRYNYKKLANIPIAKLCSCETESELLAVIREVCRV